MSEAYKVIFHLDDYNSKRMGLTFSNIVNLFDDMSDEKLEVELLVNGPAVKAFSKNNRGVLERVQQLAALGVDILVCRNALRVHGILHKDLPGEVEVVPSGVGWLVRRQAEDWMYIRP